MAFQYNVEDVKNIPGLARPGDTEAPFLTPVFFNIEVLVKYFYSPHYRCCFSSETYGSVYSLKGGNSEHYFAFGINPNSKAIAWLGDINELPPEEKRYLESENVQSDGVISSDFYEAQINLVFPSPIKEVELILFKTKLSRVTQKKFGFVLYQNINPPISEVISYCSNYKRIVFDSEDDFKRFLSIWNEELIEDLNISGLKIYLTSQGVNFPDNLGSNKLLELLITEVLQEQDNIIAPFFYLYDLRIWADHRDATSKYEAVLKNLGLASNTEYSEVYGKLIDEIYEFLNKLLDLLLNHEV